MKNLLSVFTFILVFSVSTMCFADIINIPSDYGTIQQGIDASADGDTVLVFPWLYQENINFNGKNIIVASLFWTTGDPNYISITKIDADHDGRGVTFENGEDSTAVICGFTIANGQTDIWNAYFGGGGILCYNSSPTIKNNIICDNIGDPGGGISCINSEAIIDNNTITDNWAASYMGTNYGGGINCKQNSFPRITNNIIRNNEVSWGPGGGVHANGLILENNIIYNNIATYGAGFSAGNSSSSITNNLIFGNTTVEYGYGGGACCGNGATLENNTIIENSASYGSGVYCEFSELNVLNSIIRNPGNEIYAYWGDTITVSYSNIEGGEDGIYIDEYGTLNWLEGNIDAEPLFIDPENGDFHLDLCSLGIDGGDPNSPYENEPEPNGDLINMGAYGNTAEATTSICVVSVPDTIVTTSEFSIPIMNYHEIPEPINITLNFSYNPSIINFLDYSDQGTQMEGWVINPEIESPGELSIEAFSGNLLDMSSDILLNLSFATLAGDTIDILHFDSAVFDSLLRPTRSGIVTITEAVKTKPDGKIAIPKQFNLAQNYPNPFNPVTTIQFQLPQKSHITLNIYDISGKLVETLLDEKRDAGYHSITWNAERQPSGVYFYRIVTDSGFEDVRKCVMLK
jgi:hypothetical protein